MKNKKSREKSFQRSLNPPSFKLSRAAFFRRHHRLSEIACLSAWIMLAFSGSGVLTSRHASQNALSNPGGAASS
jgi:hypothetical protein